MGCVHRLQCFHRASIAIGRVLHFSLTLGLVRRLGYERASICRAMISGGEVDISAWKVAMALFDDRKKGEENKFAKDQDLRFRIVARRNKLLGLWLAGEMGRTGQSADAYAREVIESDFERPGDDDVVEKVMADIREADLDIDEHKLRTRMKALEREAEAQVKAE